MRVEQNKIAFAYFRLSREEAQKSESSMVSTLFANLLMTVIRVVTLTDQDFRK